MVITAYRSDAKESLVADEPLVAEESCHRRPRRGPATGRAGPLLGWTNLRPPRPRHVRHHPLHSLTSRSDSSIDSLAADRRVAEHLPVTQRRDAQPTLSVALLRALEKNLRVHL